MAQTRPKAFPDRSQGFTIIEILIVLAIASLILAIVFLVVPTVQRSARNHSRKAAVEYTSAALAEYQSEHGSYPLTATGDDRAAFTSDLQSNGPTKLFTILYGTNTLSHEYPYDSPNGPDAAIDKIIIIPAHRCNQSLSVGPGDTDYPAQAASSGDQNYNIYAVYTILEAATGTPHAYCTDSEH